MTDAATLAPTPAPTAPRHRNPLGNLLRGALIGVVETVPGVSGGTVALVTGIYDELIESGHHVTAAARRLLTGPDRVAGMKDELRAVSWVLVIPLMIGMAVAVLTVAGPVARLVDAHPQTMRALFLGLVAGSVLVPVRLSGGSWRLPEALRFGIGVLAGLALTSLPQTALEPSPWIIAPAAAIAVCALVLPGLSGSFLLLSVGLYQPTLQAVDERDLGYIAWFGLWACVGLVVVVKLMRRLLTHHHRGTMVVLSGVMIGALRSLWPWQSADGALRAPAADWPLLLAIALAGVLAVQLLMLVESRIAARVAAGADR
jgi:putative membrane protein